MHVAPAYGYQAGAVPAYGGDPAAATMPDGVAVANWMDEAPSIQCVALKKNGDPCGAHKVNGTDYCVGHIRSHVKKDGEDG